MPSTDYQRQADPALNKQFRRWPPPATGNDAAIIRSWHADDLGRPPMTRARRLAEREWRRVTRPAVAT
jgi:hypothetical protein